ncbi:MAG: polyribonucleotide nucleotidyltransferase [Candidatus Aureabacteria bacterium]|nr:polyribonucleotide nucleotidyltransferase [Candidatus Auribacterota bacterium]
MEHSVNFELGGRKVEISTGKIAKQANGSVLVRMDDTVVFVSACATKSPREGIDFFPLSVDYREKTSAIGKFPGGYIKREARPTEKEILTCRLTDRPIRPLFPEDYFCEVQVVSSVLSADEENNPDVLSIIGASCALSISDIPFHGPIGAVRIGMIDDKFIINPTYEQLKTSRMDIVLAATEKGLVMVEGSALEITEECLFDALMTGFKAIQPIISAQKELMEKAGKPNSDYEVFDKVDDSLVEKIKGLAFPAITDALKVVDKFGRYDALKKLSKEISEKLIEEDETVVSSQVSSCFHDLEKEEARRLILEENVRCDGRGLKDIRDITCELGLLPRTHGSALFTRGETQALVMTTLGGPGDAQKQETYEGDAKKEFMLHYSFPPYSVGEVKFMRGPGRREIGHGILAERALTGVLPSKDDFPYTIRIISDVMESNGSSSMASVCGGALSLMDAGVPIKSPVAGIAMGLIDGGEKKAILSDILGLEDHLGDMDFKVAGTRTGITAIQMDLKIESINDDILKDALAQAKEGRMHILGVMEKTISEPRKALSKYAPKIFSFTIPKEKIGMIIGPGGSNIKRLIEQYQVEININDDGIVSVSSMDQNGIDGASEEIKLMTSDVEVGKTYMSTVKKIMEFGAFVEVLPGKEGLVHISRIAKHRVNRVEDEMKVGDKFNVKCIDIDDRGRCVLSKKDAVNDEPKEEASTDNDEK